MFGLDISTAELACGIRAEEYGSTGLFRVALEHIRTLLQNDGGRRKARARLRYGLVGGREGILGQRRTSSVHFPRTAKMPLWTKYSVACDSSVERLVGKVGANHSTSLASAHLQIRSGL